METHRSLIQFYVFTILLLLNSVATNLSSQRDPERDFTFFEFRAEFSVKALRNFLISPIQPPLTTTIVETMTKWLDSIAVLFVCAYGMLVGWQI